MPCKWRQMAGLPLSFPPRMRAEKLKLFGHLCKNAGLPRVRASLSQGSILLGLPCPITGLTKINGGKDSKHRT